ncbi:replication initiation protein [Vibrio artabrorum]|uniref:replication initiation protein n=1 Tax=Vibrio artabrorum TaxID=446374 RepID=UPI00354BAAE7
MARTLYHRNDIRPALMKMKLSSRRVFYMYLASLPREKNVKTGKVEIKFDPAMEFELSINEYACACDIDHAAAYRQLREAVYDLMSFVLTLDHKLTKKIDSNLPDDWVAPFQIAEKGSGYSKGKGFIRVKFAEEMAPLISDLSKGFTGQYLESAIAIPESNASKLYLILREWISSNRYVSEKEVLFSDFKEVLGVSELKTYESYNDFNQFFFKRSLKKLIEKTEFLEIKMEISERQVRKAHKLKISWKFNNKELNGKEREHQKFIDYVSNKY